MTEKIGGWPHYNYDIKNECTKCLLISNCVDSSNLCCVHREIPILKMCSRCRHRKEVMLK